MKLSKTQLAILRRLNSGDVIILMKGIDAHYIWRNTYNRGPRSDSVHRLFVEGMITTSPGSDDWRGANYIITAKGREYLESLPGGRCVG